MNPQSDITPPVQDVELPAQQPVITPQPQAPTPVEPTLSPIAPKKSKKALIITITVVILIAIGVIAYFTLTNNNKMANDMNVSNTQNTNSTNTPVIDESKLTPIQKEKSASLEAVTKILTDGINNETTVTNTNDSSYATGSNTAAGNVGSSINENNF